MAGELVGKGLSGSSHIFRLRTQFGKWINGTTAENWSDGNVALYSIAAVEQGTSGFFKGTMPAVAAGSYYYDLFIGSGAVADVVIDQGLKIDWDGSAPVSPASLTTAAIASAVAAVLAAAHGSGTWGGGGAGSEEIEQLADETVRMY